MQRYGFCFKIYSNVQIFISFWAKSIVGAGLSRFLRFGSVWIWSQKTICRFFLSSGCLKKGVECDGNIVISTQEMKAKGWGASKKRRHRVAAGWFRPRRAWDKDKVFAHKDRNFSHKDSFLAPYARKSAKQKREARLGASPLFLSSKIMILPCREKDKRQGVWRLVWGRHGVRADRSSLSSTSAFSRKRNGCSIRRWSISKS